jgi:hypothetical protein
MVSPKVSHLFARSALFAGVPAGNASSHPKPPADRTARGACDSVRNRTVTQTCFALTVRTARYPADGILILCAFDLLQALEVYAIPAVLTRLRRRATEAVSRRFRPLALAR